jgi:hypothetical protein
MNAGVISRADPGLISVRSSTLDVGAPPTNFPIGSSFRIGGNPNGRPCCYTTREVYGVTGEFRGFEIVRDGASAEVDDSYRKGVPQLVPLPSRCSQI